MKIDPALIVFFASMFPLGELRAGIPLGMYLGMPIESAFFWGELGNFVVVILILKLLGPVSAWLMKHSAWFNRFLTKLFHLTREKHTRAYKKYGPYLVAALVAIPFPGTGGWTGALLAFLFDMPFWKSILLITFGNLIAGTLVALGFGGAMEFIKFIKH